MRARGCLQCVRDTHNGRPSCIRAHVVGGEECSCERVGFSDVLSLDTGNDKDNVFLLTDCINMDNEFVDSGIKYTLNVPTYDSNKTIITPSSERKQNPVIYKLGTPNGWTHA